MRYFVSITLIKMLKFYNIVFDVIQGSEETGTQKLLELFENDCINSY